MPNATPTWVLNELLTLAANEPTIACRHHALRLDDRGYATLSAPWGRSVL